MKFEALNRPESSQILLRSVSNLVAKCEGEKHLYGFEVHDDRANMKTDRCLLRES
jgi:hypothetical protein